MGKFKFTVNIPSAGTTTPQNDNRIIILQENSYEGLTIGQAVYLKKVLKSWIESVGMKVTVVSKGII